MLTLEEKIKLCKNCKYQGFDPNNGIVCSLTRQKPSLEDGCQYYSAAQSQMPENVKQHIEGHAYHNVNSSAENILNIFSSILLILGVIASIIWIIIGSMAFFGVNVEGIEFLSVATGIQAIAIGVVVLLVSLIQWAMIKLFINISRNLFNLNYRVEEISNKLNR